MKKNFMKYSILIWAWMVLWVVASNIWNVFGAQDPGQGNPNVAETILNTACIEYTTPSWTGIKCDDVTITLKTGSVQENEYFIKKRQKTWGMTNYTTWQITVQSWEYIQYKVDFGSITWNCRNWTIKDILPSCVRFISSEIHDVTGSPSFSTGNGYLQYTNFRLNGGSQWYIIVTWQIIANGRNCEGTTRYVNTWAFKCASPSSEWMYSDVVAIRTWWGWWGWGSWSEVVFTKNGNKDQMVPGETWLVFTLYVENKWPETITNVVIDDIWPNPDNNGCIIYDWWSGLNWTKADGYKRNYVGSNGRLRSWQHAKLYLYAKIKNDSACVWSYINTWKLIYQVWWKPYVLYDDYLFTVVDDSAGYDVSIEKTVYPNGNVSHNQDIKYTIIYKNIWTKPLTNYTITDNWPNDKLDFKNSTPSPLTNNWDTITWFFNWPLQPWDEGRITINAKVR